MPLIVNGIKSKENDKGHGIENHAFFFGIFSYLLIEFYHNILRHL